MTSGTLADAHGGASSPGSVAPAAAGGQRLFKPAGAGNWYCWYYVNGKQITRSTRCRDRAAAAATAARLEREANGVAVDPAEEATWFSAGASSFVYFVQPVGGGPVKIGRTAVPSSRLARIQVGHPEKLQILCALPGGAHMEKIIHGAFAKCRMQGEWFAPSDRLLKLISELSRLYKGTAHKTTKRKTFTLARRKCQVCGQENVAHGKNGPAGQHTRTARHRKAAAEARAGAAVLAVTPRGSR